MRHFYFYVEMCAANGNIFKKDDDESAVDQLYRHFSEEDITRMMDGFTGDYLNKRASITRKA